MATRLIAVMLSVMLSGCYELPDQCRQDSDCTDPGTVCHKQTCVEPTQPIMDAGSTADVAALDTGVTDTGAQDTAVPVADAGAPEAGASDAGNTDSGPQGVCGDGVLDPDEECDDGMGIHLGCYECVRQPQGTGMFISEGYGCALVRQNNDDSERRVSCWGDNSEQKAGADDRIKQRLIPTLHASVDLIGVVQIAGTPSAACAILRGRRGDEIRCWGNSQYTSARGQTGQVLIPAVVDFGDSAPSNFHHLVMGEKTSCVIAGEDRKVWCWGYDSSGETGRGSNGVVENNLYVSPAKVQEPGDGVPVDLANVSSLAMGKSFAIALRTNQDNETEILGWGDLPGQPAQDFAIDMEQHFRPDDMFAGRPLQITAGANHYCVLTNDESSPLWCYGINEQGQISGEQPADLAASVRLPGINDIPTSVHAFHSGSCAVGGAEVGARNKLWCWGDNSHKQLASDQVSDSDRRNPRLIHQAPEGSSVALVAQGTLAKFRCIDVGGAINCWGRNDKDQTGNRYAGANTGDLQNLTLNPGDQPSGRDVDNPLPHCLATRDLGYESGVYWLDGPTPRPSEPNAGAQAFQVYCDNMLDSDGGGWALAMELNADTWNTEQNNRNLKYDDEFWTQPNPTPNVLVRAPQDDVGRTLKFPAALRQNFRDLYLDLAVRQVAHSIDEEALRLQTVNVPDHWYDWRGRAFNNLVEGPRINRTLHQVFAAPAEALPLVADVGAREQWLPESSENLTALVPWTHGVPIGQQSNRVCSGIMDMNNPGDRAPLDNDNSCWWAGFNRASPIGHPTRIRFGVLTAEWNQNNTCGSSYYNFVGVGMERSYQDGAQYPPVGSFGSRPSNGSHRTALWSDARIWVR